MSCYAPLKCWRTKDGGITFNRNAAVFVDRHILVPCNQCIGCKLEYSRQWAVRIMHESQMHKESLFCTFTYDPKKYHAISLDYDHFQLFMKRLRKWHSGNKYNKGKLRFFMCGEYGETTWRAHYHAILFNCYMPDSKFYSQNGQGQKLYTSETLDRLWSYGFVKFGEVTFDSAAYVARYTCAKITGPQARAHYELVDGDGVFYDRVPEFANMSRRPGIGREWYTKYGDHAHTLDSVVVNGHQVRPPRYYDNVLGAIDGDRLEALKLRRLRKAARHHPDQTPDRRRVREVVQLRKMALLLRRRVE